jgi:hypothetical protein
MATQTENRKSETIRFKPDSGQGDLLRFGMEGLVIEGEFTARYDQDEGGYVVDLDPQSVNMDGTDLEQLQQRRREADSETSAPSKPVLAVSTGYQWAGADFDRNILTEEFRTLEELKDEFNAKTSKRIGKDEDGNNVYQLIYPVEEANVA